MPSVGERIDVEVDEGGTILWLPAEVRTVRAFSRALDAHGTKIQVAQISGDAHGADHIFWTPNCGAGGENGADHIFGTPIF